MSKKLNLDTIASNVAMGPDIDVQLQATPGHLDVRDSTSQYQAVRGKDPSDLNEFTTKRYVDGDLHPDGGYRTGAEIYVDQVYGDDTTGTREQAKKPFETISAALAAALPEDAVIVRPGTYTEDIVVPTNVTLIGEGGPSRTVVAGAGGASTETVKISSGAYVVGIAAIAPAVGDAFLYDGAGLAYAYNIMVRGNTNSSVGLHFDSIFPGKIIVTEFRYVGGEFDRLIHTTNNGVLALTGLHCPPGGVIQMAISAEGGARLQLNDINVGSPTVQACLRMGTDPAGASVVIRNSAFFNAQRGFHIDGNDYTIEGQGIRFDSLAQYDIQVDVGVTGSNGTFNLTACELNERRITVPEVWLSSDHNWSFQDAKSEVDESAFRLFTDIAVGHPERGSFSDLGEGGPYARAMQVVTTDATSGPASDGLNLIDVTDAAESKDASTFTFQGASPGHSICFGSRARNGTSPFYLKSWGGEFNVVIPRIGAPDDLVVEYWTGAGIWETISMAETSEIPPFDPRGRDVFRLQGRVQVRIGGDDIDLPSWGQKTMTLAGGGSTDDLFWWRVRVVNVMTQAPEFEQVKLHPSSTRIGPSGAVEYFGLARTLVDQKLTLRDSDDLNSISPGNVDIDYGSGNLGTSGLPFTLTADVLDNNFQSGSIDGNSLTWPISPGVDTSMTATLRIWWRPSSTDTGDVFWRVGYRAVSRGSLLQSGEALDGVSEAIVPASGSLDTLDFTDIPINIENTRSGEGILALGFVRQSTAAQDTFTGNCEVCGIQLLAWQWRS